MSNAQAETAAPAAVETVAETKPATSGWQKLRAWGRAAVGVTAAPLGVALLFTGVPFAMILGAAVTFTAGRSLYEAGRELLPVKLQDDVSKFFGGPGVTEQKAPEGPKTVAGKLFRLAEYGALAFSGAAAFAAAGFAMGMGSTSSAVAWLGLGGLTSMATGAVAFVERAVMGVADIVKDFRKGGAAAPVASAEAPSAPAADLSPAPALEKKGEDFNAAAAPAAVVAEAPKSAPAPAVPAAPAA